MQPTRRSYSKSFKAEVIQECAQPGASIASIALSHSLNANLVHKWIRVRAANSSRFSMRGWPEVLVFIVRLHQRLIRLMMKKPPMGQHDRGPTEHRQAGRQRLGWAFRRLPARS
ncbi:MULTISPECIES: transposase [unclassified Pseudomonas]|uniref:transposase n=1 Tax=unclassified Pseudomonas TaxID=196821 RepID=UPI002113B7DF|nr:MULTISPECIES: transposase [unclassified Pseudomonas]